MHEKRYFFLRQRCARVDYSHSKLGTCMRTCTRAAMFFLAQWHAACQTELTKTELKYAMEDQPYEHEKSSHLLITVLKRNVSELILAAP